MAITEKKISQAALTTALQNVYTVPASARVLVKTFDLCNTADVVRQATVHFVPSTSSPNTSNMIVPGVALDARSMVQWTGLQILNEGDTVQVVADGLGVTLNMSGAESTF